MAVCADVFTKTLPNKYKGTPNDKGNVDTRDTITKVCISFLTTEMIEIDGTPKPRYASFWASASMGSIDYPSNARKFIKGWWPTLTDEQIDTGFDLDKLIGKGAYLTITHSTDKNGKVWANIAGAMQPPQGSPVPQIPADFVRHNDKVKEPAKVDHTMDEEDSDPF